MNAVLLSSMHPILSDYIRNKKDLTTATTKDGWKRPSQYRAGSNILDIDNITDDDWVSDGFVTPMRELTPLSRRLAVSSPCDITYTDSSLGGNYSLNARPQFSPYADPRRGLLIRPSAEIVDTDIMGIPNVPMSLSPAVFNSSHPIYTGMGRIYNEKHEITKQTIRLEFGVPKFQALGLFWTSFLDPEVETLARTGVVPGTLHKVGTAAISAVLMWTFPLAAIATWVGKKVGALLFGQGGGGYYRVEPTPHIYLATINTMVNHYLTLEGLYPGSMAMDNTTNGRPNETVLKTQLELLKAYMPNVFNDQYGVDMFAVTGRVEAIRRVVYKSLKENESNIVSGIISEDGVIQKAANKAIYARTSGITSKNKRKYTTLYDVMNGPEAAWVIEKNVQDIWVDIKAAAGEVASTVTGSDSSEGEDGGGDANDLATKNKITEVIKSDPNYSADIFAQGDPKSDKEDVKKRAPKADEVKGYLDWVKIFADQGAQYLTLDVDYTGPTTTTFTNTTAPIEFGATFNSMSGGSRSMKYNLSGGNIVDGLIGSVFEVVGAVGKMAMEAVSSVDLGLTAGIRALIHSAEVEMPNRYDSSAISLPGSTYSMVLVSHAGDVISRLTNIWIPIFSLIAGTAPRSTGYNSHTSPLLCRLYDVGHSNIDVGIITNLSISVMEGTLGTTLDNKPLQVKVTFTVTNLDPIKSVPISTGSFFAGDKSRTMGIDSPWNAYMETLTARSIADRTWITRRAAVNKALLYKDWEALKSPAGWGHTISGWAPIQLIGSLTGTYAAER